MQKMHPFAMVLTVLIIGATSVLITDILTNQKVEVEFESSIPTTKLKRKMKVY